MTVEEVDEILAAPWIGKENFIKLFRQHPEHTERLYKLAVQDLTPQSWRSAWLIRHAIGLDNKIYRKYVDEFIDCIPIRKDGHQRELLLVLDKMQLNEDQQGKLLDYCLTIWESIAKKPSTRITAFKFFLKMAKKYPELLAEVEVLTEDHYTETLSPGIKRQLLRLVGKFKK